MQKEKTYYEELEEQIDPYGQWIAMQEGTGNTVNVSKEQAWQTFRKDAMERHIQIITYQQGLAECVIEEAVVLFVDDRGIPNAAMLQEVQKAFEKELCQLVYGEEDVLDAKGKRMTPWFKPEWSPDTLTSYLYFGSAFAVRAELLQGITCHSPHQIALAATAKLKPFGIKDRECICHSDRIWYHSITEQNEWQEKKENQAEPALQGAFVSIIIPSKDNSEILRTCLSTLQRLTEYQPFEILVVDNGSKMEEKQKIEELQKEIPFRYYYQPMEFNFAAMCNIGARAAKGDYLLLLNDDMEIIQGNWLQKMMEHASLPHVGAVGAKLLYPGSNKIQHVGVTNLAIGPGHKLTTVSDEGVIYHGANCRVLNMLAVTAACLLIQKRKYDLAGGMCEELKVAYNDVEFCFTLYELGFYNVQNNEAVLYHHESLSRGDDITTKDKYKRLLAEKDKLYSRHPKLYQKDPFYSKHLSTNSLYYTCNFLHPYEDKSYLIEPDKKEKKRLFSCKNLQIHYHIDRAELEQKMETKEEEHYLITGWSFLKNVDNADYRTYLLLENENQKYWRFPIVRQMRKDVMPVAIEQTNAELSGFVLRFRTGVLESGSYRIIIMKKHIKMGINFYFETENQIDISKIQ